jgi:uncharacterized protein involved in outer membrane biogenesis
MSNGLLYIAGLVALALAALFAVPYFIDWNGYRGVFEEEASRVLGREVRVGGNVNVRLLPAPFVSFDRLRIADTTGTTGEPFFRAEAFTMRLSVPPLLKGIIEANEIELKRPVLNLALDAQGGGNWRSFSITPGTLPFVPADVTLQSVMIRDGVVTMHGPRGAEFAQLDGLNGELKAESIDGPFSFKGTAQWKGEDREFRVATAPADADGNFRFKSTVRGPGSGTVYAIDGSVDDLKGHPRVNGEVTAKLELDASQMPQRQAGAEAPAEAPLIDFKAQMQGDADGLKLQNITVSFERVGRPQLVTGAAEASWSDDLKVDLRLASRWLDLDRIAASDGVANPFETSRSFVSAVMQALPEKAETKARFDLDQATLGGEAVSGIQLDLARSDGTLLLEGLRAGMPGGTKLALDGSVANVAGEHTFQGEFALRGTSLGRFLKWAVKDPAVAKAVRSDGRFSLQGRLAMSDKSLDLTEASAEIAGRPLGGEVHYGGGERKRLAVVLEGQEVDAGELWPASVGYLKGLLGGEPAQQARADGPAATGLRRLFDVSNSDLALRVRVAKLLTGAEPLQNVDIDVAVEGGALTVRRCKFATDEGFALDMEGAIADTDGQPSGALRWVVAAPDRDAFTAFVRLLSLSDNAAEDARRYAGLTPMRLAGTIDLGQRAAGTADINADGTIEGGRVVASARFDGGLDNWRSGRADLTLTLMSPDVVRAFDDLTARGAPIGSGGPAQRPGEIFFKAVGIPAAGMLANATVKASGLFFAYDGTLTMPGDANRHFDGDVRVSSRELGNVMALAGLGSGGALQGVPVVGTIKMVSRDHAVEFKPQQLSVGESKVGGSLVLAYPGEGPGIVTAQLKVDKATIPGLLSVALSPGSGAATQAEPLTAGKSVWPESAFDFSALDGVEGKLGVTFGTLTLEPGMDIRKAQLDVALAPGKVAVTRLEGKALGGSVLAHLLLERAPGGADVSGDVRFNDIRLKRRTAKPGSDADGGVASVTLQFSGRASTPGGLVAVAVGKGEMKLGDVSMHLPTPLAVVETSEAALSGNAGAAGEALTAALRQKMAESQVKVGPRAIGIDVADGAARFAEFTLPSPAGATKVSTTVDLASLMVDSTWLLEPAAPDVERPDLPRKGALPPVEVVYVGPLKDVWSIDPRISAEPLERELAIRKMELDAEQLERLHRLDQQRARELEERRRAIEESQADDAPAPAAPAEAPSGAMNPDAVERQPLATPAVPEVDVDPLVGLPPQSNGDTLTVPPPPGAPYAAQPKPLPEVTDPAAVGAADVAPFQDPAAAETVAPAPQEAARPRKRAWRRQVPAGEQVLRALQNAN